MNVVCLRWHYEHKLIRVISVRDFRLHSTISVVFTIYSLAVTCFGRTTIFKRKYNGN
jgi:hypothetical protein